MKRVLIVCAVLLLPVAAFAQVQVGATALYNFPYFTDGAPDELDPSDFTFGVDARMKVFVFQVSGLGLFTPGTTDELGDPVSGSIDLFLDGGVAFDVLLFRFGLGLGPSLRVNLEQGSEATGLGLNVKGTADVMLGRLSLGLTYLNQFEFDFSDAAQLLDEDYTKGRLGVSVLLSPKGD